MQVIMEPGQRVPIKAWVDGVELEDAARKQLVNLAKMPFVHRHVAVMPDVHWGRGATVGSVIATHDAIIPAAVGVDLGCGMAALRTSLRAEDLPDDLHAIRLAIEATIPVGQPSKENDAGGSHRDVPADVVDAWSADLADRWPLIVEHFERYGAQLPRRHPTDQLGTLGGGNHFVEVCLDEEGRVWLMLHSGSRNVGKRIAEIFIELAQRDMKRWYINLPDAELAYIPQGAEHFQPYLDGVAWAQDYARLNRQLMLGAILEVLRGIFPAVTVSDEAIYCHHNYVSRENHFGKNVLVTRKGAVRAREGDLGIIPGSMGTRSYIVRGKGNADSFTSCSHGAGRRMSRGEAKRRITLEDHAAATAGVECRKDADVLDESPAAYKSIDAVIEAERDLVDVVHTLRAVVCVKG
jgi:tRNA-splicing ligase RtcB (3'-phosphate/5'-hydroxy nucleic acid ligase)